MSNLVPEAPESAEDTPHFNLRDDGCLSFTQASAKSAGRNFLPVIQKTCTGDRKNNSVRFAADGDEEDDIICGG